MPAIQAWLQLSNRNKAAAIGTAVAITLAIAALVKAATTPHLSLLYAGLDPATSGEILQALETMDVIAEARGEAIYVPENKRDAIRMALAREGLPRQSQAGFEILDNLKSFATSSELFDATYWRAKEGELARTILAEPGVRSARVHLAIPKRPAFSRGEIAPSAVVTVKMSLGRLDVERAQAVRLLIALAVPGLSPENVAVLDAAGGVVLAPGGADDTQRLIDKTTDREKVLERDLLQLLEASVGAGNARVKVTLVVSDDQVVRKERVVDPDRRALATSETTQSSEQGSGASGVVTVASNLPDGDASATNSPERLTRNESSESVRYELSEVKTEMVTPPGALRQIQVAVLVNHSSSTGDDGAQITSPRSPEELEALRQLVAAAIGYNESRGDIVTIQSLPFNKLEPAGTEVESDFFSDILEPNLIPALQLIIPALVTLILALFVVRPLLTSTGPAKGAAPNEAATPAVTLEELSPQILPRPQPTHLDELHRIAAEDQQVTSAVLKSWLEQSEAAR